MKHIRASGSAALIIRAVKTMGVMVIEMFLAMSGNRVLAIMLQAGAAGSGHEVQLLGHFVQEVVGLVHRAQVGADGHFHRVAEAHLLQGGLQLGGGVQGRGNWLMKAGATRAYTRSPRLKLWIS